MYRENTFLRLMRCFRCMIIEDEPDEPASPKKIATTVSAIRVNVDMEPPGIVESKEVILSDSDDDWVLAD